MLRYPNKSHRKKIKIPIDRASLAELIGIIYGDGGINNDWQLVISLNSKSDLEYSLYIESLINDLFNLKVAIRKRPNQNTLVIVASSMNLIDFLILKGVIKGNKLNGKMETPHWIRTNQDFKKRFIRGLIDTDGCIYIHKHKIKGINYINIGLCFSSASKSLIYSVADILNQFDIKPHIHKNEQYIFLYGEKSIVQYLSIFGSSNPRIYNKLNQWRDARVV